MIKITLEDHASAQLQALLARVRGIGPTKEAGRGVSNLLRDHFRALDDRNPNKLGGKRQNLWSAIARSVQNPVPSGPGEVTVAINHEAIRQKVEGGTIRPVNKKWLTIPANAEAYGKSASDFRTLTFIPPSAGKAGALVTVPHSTLKRSRRKRDKGQLIKDQEQAGGEVMFWLVKKVTQKPFPGALPKLSALISAAVAGAEEYLDAGSSKP